jgi:hypothetical protein
MKSSRRLGNYLTKIVDDDPRFSFFDDNTIYGCEQKVWRVNYRDLINMTDLV